MRSGIGSRARTKRRAGSHGRPTAALSPSVRGSEVCDQRPAGQRGYGLVHTQGGWWSSAVFGDAIAVGGEKEHLHGAVLVHPAASDARPTAILLPSCRRSWPGSSGRRQRRKCWRIIKSGKRRRFCRQRVSRGWWRCRRRAGCGCFSIRTPRSRWRKHIRLWSKAVSGRMGCSSARTCSRGAVSSTPLGRSLPSGSSPPRIWYWHGSSDPRSHRWRNRSIRGRCRSGNASTYLATSRVNTRRWPK